MIESMEFNLPICNVRIDCASSLNFVVVMMYSCILCTLMIICENHFHLVMHVSRSSEQKRRTRNYWQPCCKFPTMNQIQQICV